jgi:hypothetical protein
MSAVVVRFPVRRNDCPECNSRDGVVRLALGAAEDAFGFCHAHRRRWRVSGTGVPVLAIGEELGLRLRVASYVVTDEVRRLA